MQRKLPLPLRRDSVLDATINEIGVGAIFLMLRLSQLATYTFKVTWARVTSSGL